MLTPAERELARLVCESHSNKQIAAQLGRSVNTVKSGLHQVFGKLGMTSRTRLVVVMQQ